MKVSRPPSGSSCRPKSGVSEVKHSGTAGFAEKLAKASGSGKAQATGKTSGAVHAAKVSGVSDIGQALKAGHITPQAAIERVVERVVDRQAGPNAPAAAKQQLAAVLRQALEDDPTLAAKVRALAGPDSE
jgi:hypothetical protein